MHAKTTLYWIDRDLLILILFIHTCDDPSLFIYSYPSRSHFMAWSEYKTTLKKHKQAISFSIRLSLTSLWQEFLLHKRELE